MSNLAEPYRPNLDRFSCAICGSKLDIVTKGDPPSAELEPQGRHVTMTVRCPRGCTD